MKFNGLGACFGRKGILGAPLLTTDEFLFMWKENWPLLEGEQFDF